MTERQIHLLTEASKSDGYARTHDRGEGPLLYFAELKGWIKGSGEKRKATVIGKAALREALAKKQKRAA